jgi:hypothetical protein
VSLTFHSALRKLNTEPSIAYRCSHQISVRFGKAVSEKKIFRKRPIRKKNCLWWPCLLTDWDKMSNLYKRTFHRCFLPSFGSFGQAVTEEKNCLNQPIRNKSCLWRPCLLTDRDEMSILYRGSSIDASYQVSVHLAEGF